MLYVSQLDYQHIPYRTMTDKPDDDWGINSTVRSSGCGLCAAVMVADRLLIKPKFGVKSAVALSYKTGANHGVGTDYGIFAPAFAKRFGFKLEKTSSLKKLEKCLKTGGCAVAHVRPAPDGSKPYFSNGGHYITVIGVEPDGRFAILDPSLKPDKFDTPERRGKVEVKGKICFCAPAVLEHDVEWSVPENRGFYLFSR